MKKEILTSYGVELASYVGTLGVVHNCGTLAIASLRDGEERLVFMCTAELAAQLEPLWGCTARLQIETITTGGKPRHRLISIEAVYGR